MGLTVGIWVAFIWLLGYRLSGGPMYARVMWPVSLVWALREWKAGRAKIIPPWRKR